MLRIVAACLLCAFGTAAQADGPYKWTGFYVGAHAGYGWSVWDGNMIYTDAQPGDGFDASGHTIDAEGAIAGGQIGFNVQSGNVVWGLEADGSWSDINGSQTLLPYPNNPGSPAWGFESQIDWLATVRGRLGFTSGSVLVYGTAGAAFAEVDSRLSVFATGPQNAGHIANGAKNETRTGWTAGGGVEWMFAPNWSLKTEYLYVNLGEVGGILPGTTTTGGGPARPHTTDGFSGDLDLHTVRVGVNYNFNGN